MAIEVKHGSGGTAIKAAFAGGQAMAQQQADNQMRQSGLAIAARQQQQRDMLASQPAMPGSDQAGQMAQQSQLPAENETYELSAQQQAEYNKYSDAIAKVQTDDRLSDEEKNAAMQDLLTKQAQIKPVGRVKKASPWPEGQGVGQTWIDNKTGMVATRDSKGELSLKPNPRMISAQDIAKWADSVPKKYDAASNEIAPTPEEIRAHVQLQAQLWREINGIAGGSPVMADGTDEDNSSAVIGAMGPFNEVVYDGTNEDNSSAVIGAMGPFNEVVYDGTNDNKQGDESGIGALGTAAASMTKAVKPISDTIIETRKKYIIANDDKMTRQQVLDAWEGMQKKDSEEDKNKKAQDAREQLRKIGAPIREGIDWKKELKNLWDVTDVSTIPKRVSDVAVKTPVVGDALSVADVVVSNFKKDIDLIRGKSQKEKKKLIKEKKLELWGKLLESNNTEDNKKLALAIQELEKLEEE